MTTDDWGRALADERDAASSIDDPLLRARREVLAKGIGVAGGWGIFAQDNRLSSPRAVDVAENGKRRRTYPSEVEVEAIGPDGERLRTRTSRPEEVGPLTLWHIAAAVPAICRAVMDVTRWDIEQLGGSIAATMTDALVVPCAPEARLAPCDGGPHRLPDGTEAVRLVSHDELRAVLGRWDPVLQPKGGAAWKVEVDCLDRPTVGLVLGVNKVLMARADTLELVRSSDTAQGDHFLDPTGSNARLEDGRTAWSAALQEPLVRHVVETGTLGVPDDLPGWADDRPVMRSARTTTVIDHYRLRNDVGDLDGQLPPFTDYITAGDGGPVCLATDRDPATWRDWPWFFDGELARVAIVGRDGELIESHGRGPVFVIETHRGHLLRWLREEDPTLVGPRRGLRRPAPIESHPALVELVGRSTTWQGAGGSEPVTFPSFTARDDLVFHARSLGSGALIGAGVPPRTAGRIVAGGRPDPLTVERLAVAVAVTSPRQCAGPGCQQELQGRSHRRFCSDACSKRARRAASRSAQTKDAFAGIPACACGTVLFGAAARQGMCSDCTEMPSATR